jgi:mRNA-degrading endonuclease RelE of RelBE toxin-antitoxin system
MVLVETSIFSKLLPSYWSDDEYAAFQSHLAKHPESGDLIRGGGGARKVRWAASGKGKSGGVRVIYYWFRSDVQIVLLTIFGKGERDNLSAAELKQISAHIKRLK